MVRDRPSGRQLVDRNTDEIVIVGGGIAGSGLAALLAAGGLRVDVLERTTEYPDRVRGEMYCPWGSPSPRSSACSSRCSRRARRSAPTGARELILSA
jgi:choline dehydrogenase-like flavoprotein